MSRIRASAACDATGLTLRGLQAMAAHGANEERTAPGTDPGTGSIRLIQAMHPQISIQGET